MSFDDLPLIFGFLALCFVLFGRESRRAAWIVILLFTCLDMALNPFVDRMNYKVAGAVLPFFDILQVCVLISLGSRFALCQSIAVSAIGLTGFVLAYDLIFDRDLVYSSYEAVILSLAATQILIGSDGIAKRIYKNLRAGHFRLGPSDPAHAFGGRLEKAQKHGK